MPPAQLFLSVLCDDPLPPDFLARAIAADLTINIIEAPAPIIVGDTVTQTHPDCTNQKLIDAIHAAAVGETLGYAVADWWSWMVKRAQIEYIAFARDAPYDGPPLESLNWSRREREAVIAELAKQKAP